MSDCDLLRTCIFFNDKMADMPSTAEVFKLNYCRGDNTKCARYMVFTARGREHVPPDLFPGQVEFAQKVIASS